MVKGSRKPASAPHEAAAAPWKAIAAPRKAGAIIGKMGTPVGKPDGVSQKAPAVPLKAAVECQKGARPNQAGASQKGARPSQAGASQRGAEKGASVDVAPSSKALLKKRKAAEAVGEEPVAAGLPASSSAALQRQRDVLVGSKKTPQQKQLTPRKKVRL